MPASFLYPFSEKQVGFQHLSKVTESPLPFFFFFFLLLLCFLGSHGLMNCNLFNTFQPISVIILPDAPLSCL